MRERLQSIRKNVQFIKDAEREKELKRMEEEKRELEKAGALEDEENNKLEVIMEADMFVACALDFAELLSTWGKVDGNMILPLRKPNKRSVDRALEELKSMGIKVSIKGCCPHYCDCSHQMSFLLNWSDLDEEAALEASPRRKLLTD